MSKKQELMATAITNTIGGIITGTVTTVGLGKVFPKATTIKGKLIRGLTISALAGAAAEPCFRSAKEAVEKYNKVSRKKEEKKENKKNIIVNTYRNYWDMVDKYNNIKADMLIASTLINSLSDDDYVSPEYRVHMHKILTKIHKGICLMSNELNIPLKAAITEEVAHYNAPYEYTYSNYVKFIRVVEFYLQIDEYKTYIDPLAKKKEDLVNEEPVKEKKNIKDNKKDIRKALSKFNAPGSIVDE